MNNWYLIILFLAVAGIGGKLIRNVPSLLHTPLMSGMNALSGITILGALTAAAFAQSRGSVILGMLAVTLALINVVSGFIVTFRMLRMFRKKT